MAEDFSVSREFTATYQQPRIFLSNTIDGAVTIT